MKKTIIFIGLNGFPYGSAAVQRQIHLGKSLLMEGNNVIVINRKGIHNKAVAIKEKIKTKGVFQGITYYYSSMKPYRTENFILRNLFKFIGFINEFFLIFFLKKTNKNVFFFNNSIQLGSLKYYYFLSRIFNIKLLYDYVEIISSLGKRKLNIKSINQLDSRFDYFFPKYTDFVIVISAFLEKHIIKLYPQKKILKIPPIVDFTFIENIKRIESKEPYFLFCGSAGYYDIINFIILAFNRSKALEEGNKYNLKLVLNGTAKQLKDINDYINTTTKRDSIEVLSNLSYETLITMYKSGFALLIPMSDNIQDQARFPFKLCEYTASKRPIITSESGPIKDFFKDKINALIAKTNNVEDFTLKMDYLIENPIFADEIGNNCYLSNKSVFNYQTYSKEMNKFIET